MTVLMLTTWKVRAKDQHRHISLGAMYMVGVVCGVLFGGCGVLYGGCGVLYGGVVCGVLYGGAGAL